MTTLLHFVDWDSALLEIQLTLTLRLLLFLEISFFFCCQCPNSSISSHCINPGLLQGKAQMQMFLYTLPCFSRLTKQKQKGAPPGQSSNFSSYHTVSNSGSMMCQLCIALLGISTSSLVSIPSFRLMNTQTQTHTDTDKDTQTHRHTLFLPWILHFPLATTEYRSFHWQFFGRVIHIPCLYVLISFFHLIVVRLLLLPLC